MIEIVKVPGTASLDEYAAVSALTLAVHEFRAEAEALVPLLRGRKIWMVNSTSAGGGVAEMMPKMLLLLRDLGVDVDWAVIGTRDERFFSLTKQVHNLIHGSGDPTIGDEDRAVYEAVNRENADDFRRYLEKDHILVVHDPQPAAMGSMLAPELGIPSIWRCHIGLDDDTEQTRAAWEFLRPYLETYDRAVFTAPEYIPDYLAGRSTIIHPAIDPFSNKNRQLSMHRVVEILVNAGIIPESEPVVLPPFEHRVQRLAPDGRFCAVTDLEPIGLLYRPIITQVSRWDRLKGWKPLLDGFLQLKRSAQSEPDPVQRRRLELARFVMAGPDPASIQDDPEGQEVLTELIETYCSLTPKAQQDVALLSLPMESRAQNALMVNALQRSSTIVAQNSLQEGFGLTATEAMWKRVPVLSSQACGIRQQINDGIHGALVADASDPDEIAFRMGGLLRDLDLRASVSRNAQRRVQKEFLVFTQLRDWLKVIAECAAAAE